MEAGEEGKAGKTEAAAEPAEEHGSKVEEKEEVRPDRPKMPVSKLVELVPAASALREEERRLSEKRIRIKYDYNLEPEEAKINPRLARELGISDKLEIVVAGRHRFAFKAVIDEDAEYNRVYVNPDLMEEHGVADNSIATLRAYRGSEELGVRLSP